MWKIKNATNVFEYVLKIVLRNVSQKSLKRYLYEALFYLVGGGGEERGWREAENGICFSEQLILKTLFL